MPRYFIGIDVGSSFVKTSILDGDSGIVLGVSTQPDREQSIQAPQSGWAEQDPELWWKHFVDGYRDLIQTHSIDTKAIAAIGISYQMHGLVLVDEDLNAIRPSIIWCDSRATGIGEEAFQKMGESKTLEHLLNSPGNFTASKLAWVMKHEPEVIKRVHKFMLPGDYIACKLSGQATTTISGLSEGIFWDYKEQKVSTELMDYFGIEENTIPEIIPTFHDGLSVSKAMADELGISPDTKISYRAGDQPNNAFSLNVLEPGEVAATGGTSGVIYAVTDQNMNDKESRINTFVHVNNRKDEIRNGVLICINGSGILYQWLRNFVSTGGEVDYNSLNKMAERVDPGSYGLSVFPFGNGAERVLNNRVVQAHFGDIEFNRHTPEHLVRAGLEGIVFAMNIGFDILQQNGLKPTLIKAGYANLFLSETFRKIFTNVTNTPVEWYDTDGSVGAARGAALGIAHYKDTTECFENLNCLGSIEPDTNLVLEYRKIYESWLEKLNKRLL